MRSGSSRSDLSPNKIFDLWIWHFTLILNFLFWLSFVNFLAFFMVIIWILWQNRSSHSRFIAIFLNYFFMDIFLAKFLELSNYDKSVKTFNIYSENNYLTIFISLMFTFDTFEKQHFLNYFFMVNIWWKFW